MKIKIGSNAQAPCPTEFIFKQRSMRENIIGEMTRIGNRRQARTEKSPIRHYS